MTLNKLCVRRNFKTAAVIVAALVAAPTLTAAARPTNGAAAALQCNAIERRMGKCPKVEETAPTNKTGGTGKSGKTGGTGSTGSTGKSGKTGGGKSGGGKTGGGQNSGYTTLVPIKGVRNLVRVVFTTGAEPISLVSNGELIGESKAGKVSGFMSEGAHDVFVKKDEEVLPQAIAITVSQKNTAFNIANEVSEIVRNLNDRPQPDSTDTQANAVQPNVQSDPPSNVVNVAALLDDYADPQKSDSIKAEDWQSAWTQCLQQLAVGSKEKNLEGACIFAHAQVEMANGATASALKLFNSATTLMSDSPVAFYGYGDASLRAGNESDAVTALNRAIRLDNKFALAYKRLGDVYLAQNRVKEASQHYQTAKNSGMDTPELRLALALTIIKTKNCAAGMEELSALEKTAPSADLYIALGDCHLERDRQVSAVEAFTEATRLAPSLAMAHFKLGKTYFDQKEFGKAVAPLERSLALVDADGKPLSKTIKLKELQEMVEKAKSRSKK